RLRFEQQWRAKISESLRFPSAIRVIPDFPKPGLCFQDITTLLLEPKAFKDTIDLFVERYKDKNISVVAGIEARGFIFGPPIALSIGAKFVPMRNPRSCLIVALMETVFKFVHDKLVLEDIEMKVSEANIDDLVKIKVENWLGDAKLLLKLRKRHYYQGLEGEVISEEYSLEYGTDKMEMHVGAVQSGERALIIDDLIATGGTLCAAIRLLERVGVEVVECACVIELPELKGRDRLGDKPLFVLVSAV
ncbi:hypothetical protein GIB67_001900, partial [Kingdonia uniflora]